MDDLHIFFLPFLAPGHMIPMVDLAKLFAARGVKATVITTTGNVSRIEPSLNRSPHPVQLLTIPFPLSAPDNFTSLPTSDFTPEFRAALESLKTPFEHLLIEQRPDCIVSDLFYPWSADVAAEHSIPRVVFHGSSSFVGVVFMAIFVSKIHQAVPEEDESFVVPGIPHRIEMLKSQLVEQDEHGEAMMESLKKTYGTVMNTFYDMEPGYTDRFHTKTWLVGPVGLCNRDALDRAVRGGGRGHELDRCLEWLDCKNLASVLYVCFGSAGHFTTPQLSEIARGLSSSGCAFVWVVRIMDDDASDWIPEGFEEKGLIIKGWAPQMAILDHPAVGGFMTHCGWNSCLEGATSGVPMITWPLFADQFFNERLLVDVVRIGFAVGSKVNTAVMEERPLVSGEEVKKAVEEVMGGGEEAAERRKRAKEVAKLARKAVEEGGSSCNDLNNMIQELKEIKAGLIIKGWAPQTVILDHQAVGGFLTHCGWNSCLEGTSSGVPMITWPLFAEQFFNERLLVDVLGVGFAVGSKVCSNLVENRTIVSREEVKKAIEEVMGSGEGAEERRNRAREVAVMAKRTMEEGGSSCNDLSNMLRELEKVKAAKIESAKILSGT